MLMSKFPYLVFGTGERVDGGSNELELVTLSPTRLTHTHFIGKTGSGKSTLIASQFVQLLWLAKAGILIDPAGDLTRLVLKLLIQAGYFEHHPRAFSDLVYLNVPAAARQDYFLPCNILDMGYDPETTAATVLEAFKRAWAPLRSGQASNIELLIKVGVMVLATHKLPLYPFLRLLLTSQAARDRLLADITDPEIHSAFALYGLRRNAQMPESMKPTVRRFISFLLSPVLRYSLGQRENALNFSDIIAHRRSIALNLNVRDPDAMRMLGCLCTVFLELAGRTYLEVDAAERDGSHMIYLDEFQNFVAHSQEALSTMFVEMRKAGLFLGLAHQSMAQVPASMYGALNQCGIRAVFKLDPSDAAKCLELLNFPYDPYKAKPPIINLLNPRVATPHFYSRAEQQAEHLDSIVQLAEQEAFLQLPKRPLYRIRSLEVENAGVAKTALEAVETEYLTRYFRPKADIEASITRKLQELGLAEPDEGDEPSAGGPPGPDHGPGGNEGDEGEEGDFHDQFSG